jgi:hypothetical protein
MGGTFSTNWVEEECIQGTGYWWVDSIKTDLGKIGWGGVDWFGLAQDRDKCP